MACKCSSSSVLYNTSSSLVSMICVIVEVTELIEYAASGLNDHQVGTEQLGLETYMSTGKLNEQVNPLLIVTRSEIACVRVVGKCGVL